MRVEAVWGMAGFRNWEEVIEGKEKSDMMLFSCVVWMSPLSTCVTAIIECTLVLFVYLPLVCLMASAEMCTVARASREYVPNSTHLLEKIDEFCGLRAMHENFGMC